MTIFKHINAWLKKGTLTSLLISMGLGSVYAGPGPGDGTTQPDEDITCNQAEFVTQLTSQQLQAYYTKRHFTDGFNGAVLIAKDGKPIYSGAFGYANYASGDTISTQTSFQLASVSKTFTSAAVLQLVEAGTISLNDSLQKFFPGFPYHGITVKLLLSHRSGLPDYIYWDQQFIGYGVQYLTNQGLVDLLITKHPPLKARPDRLFNYCNTNYALLALIVEKASGLTYKEYLQQHIFTPFGMANTYICTIQDTASMHCGATCYQARRWQEWKWAFSDGVVGDKNIYSSVEDMLKWDNALKSGKVLGQEMLNEAYKPHSLDRYSFAKDKRRNYGYGWRMIKQPDNSYLIYHNGNWHGCNNVFCRNLTQGYTVIVLGNKENGANYQTQAVWDIIARVKNSENMAASDSEQ